MSLSFPQIDPVAFSMGPLDVRWYGLAYLAGFLLAWRYCLYLAGLDKEIRPSRQDVDDFLPWAIIGVLLGGRLGYVLFYKPSYYLQNPQDILKIWEGGMAFHGGALGVIAALFVYPYVKGFSRLRLADIVCAGVPIGLFFGRIANFINGELYGRVSNVPWAMVFPHAGPQPRHPSQLYEAFLEGLVLFALLFVLIKSSFIRNRPGIVSGTFLAGYGIFRGAVEFARQPDDYLGFVLGPLSMGQILSLPMIGIGAGLVLWSCRYNQARPSL